MLVELSGAMGSVKRLMLLLPAPPVWHVLDLLLTKRKRILTPPSNSVVMSHFLKQIATSLQMLDIHDTQQDV